MPEDQTPRETFADAGALRRAARAGRLTGPTAGLCPGAEQANLAVLPADVADAFLRFCVANPKPCPVLAVSEPGSRALPALGDDLDVACDLPGYRVWRDGEVAATPADVADLWRDDLVAFALGCSFGFEAALARADLPLRHVAAGRNVPMYATSIKTAPAGPFGGPLVVSMRPFPPAAAIRAIAIAERYPRAHGAPVHLGDPGAIGIADLDRPDFGDPPVMRDGDVPLFWACGVTPQMAIARARLPFAITHDPGRMLVTGLNVER